MIRVVLKPNTECTEVGLLSSTYQLSSNRKYAIVWLTIGIEKGILAAQ